MARTVNVGVDALSSGSFAPAPAGTKVKATIFDIEETTVKGEGENQGKPQAVVTVKIVDDFRFDAVIDGKTVPQNLKGREVRYNNVPFYAGKGGWNLAAFAAAVGWDVDPEGNVIIPDEGDLGPNTLGREVVVQLGIRTAQNDPTKKYQTVARWLPASSKTSAGAGGSGAPAGGSPSPADNPWA